MCVAEFVAVTYARAKPFKQLYEYDYAVATTCFMSVCSFSSYLLKDGDAQALAFIFRIANVAVLCLAVASMRFKDQLLISPVDTAVSALYKEYDRVGTSSSLDFVSFFMFGLLQVVNQEVEIQNGHNFANFEREP